MTAGGVRTGRTAPTVLLLVLLALLVAMLSPLAGDASTPVTPREPGSAVVQTTASLSAARPGSPTRPVGIVVAGVVALGLAGWVVALVAPNDRVRLVLRSTRVGARAPPAAI